MKPLKIVFAGTPEFALPSLSALWNSHHHLIAVYTQPDRPAGRGRKLQASPVKEWAINQNIPVYQPLNFKRQEEIETLAALAPDVMVVIAYGLLLPCSVLAIPRLGCINVHASLLPKWRGASPIQHAILHGDLESGVTIMQMDKGMDTGDMLTTTPCTISEIETAATLHDKLAKLAIEPLLNTLDQLAEGTMNATIQDHNSATYAPKIKKEDARIYWDESAAIIDRKIRAFNPWPVAYTHIEDTILRIHQAQIIPEKSQQPPGTILKLNKEGMTVATSDNVLLVKRIQFPGGKAMNVSDWLNAGRRDLQAGLILK
ncbi:methionyl-tRNA formyltransferase [Legionella impletisoli]|uniref:Methionyl-tRNA formyltransferase n=1 Tax=Legionella impletisoli TaxID=343510 RepID=A0A917JV99_9GAMM|nr:methionyl-tRNA formyltransferase [Legionella impletisoli]GGI88527.1 methionyl-tRNA formyltransferase [Legionella impletisoli]